MRVALISFEYPPAVAVGGIGTYGLEAVKMLTRGGVEVEVFSAGAEGTTTCEAAGVPVHRVVSGDRNGFSERIAPIVVRRHSIRPFDVFESPEIGAEGAAVAEAIPEMARVVKLHTPSYLVGRNGYEPPTLLEHLRFSLGSLRRGRINVLRRPSYRADDDKECTFARSADEIAAPSGAIATILEQDWNLPAERISCFPLPFLPNLKLLALPPASEAKTVGFLGRMEPRKGIIELTRAIPKILQQASDLRFRFIGPSWPFKQGDMQSWIESQLSRCRGSLEFVGSVTQKELPEQLAKCDVLVLPSRWENFPFACIESLTAGRAVIGSVAGGMAEMIEDGRTGLLISPRSSHAIAEAILFLVRNPQRVRQFGEAGRKSIVEKLSPDRVFPMQMASYQRAIARACARISHDDGNPHLRAQSQTRQLQ